jgi:exonuclease III
MSVSSHIFASLLDVYEPFSSPTLPKLRIATLNARSLCNKSAVISDHILHNKLDILCVTETWVNDGEFSNSFASSLLPPNYSLSQYYGRPRPIRGGGLAIFSHKSIHHTSISMPVYSTFECIGSTVSLSTFSFKIFTIYRPPSSSISTFCTEFETLLEHHITSNIDLFFIGDFNIHIDNQDDPNSILCNRLLHTLNLNQHIFFRLIILVTHSI